MEVQPLRVKLEDRRVLKILISLNASIYELLQKILECVPELHCLSIAKTLIKCAHNGEKF